MLHLLLVEDNSGDVRLVQEALRTSGANTDLTVASDGEQALRYLRSLRFDLVILDLNLPKRDGQTVLQLCAASEGAPPFVVFSGSHRETDRESAFLVGAKEYVVKPTNLDEFIKTVQGLLERWSNPFPSGGLERGTGIEPV